MPRPVSTLMPRAGSRSLMIASSGDGAASTEACRELTGETQCPGARVQYHGRRNRLFASPSVGKCSTSRRNRASPATTTTHGSLDQTPATDFPRRHRTAGRQAWSTTKRRYGNSYRRWILRPDTSNRTCASVRPSSGSREPGRGLRSDGGSFSLAQLCGESYLEQLGGPDNEDPIAMSAMSASELLHGMHRLENVVARTRGTTLHRAWAFGGAGEPF